MSGVQGILLAAGVGSRLAPITDGLPKPLFPFFDAPIAARAVDAFAAGGVARWGANTWHAADRMEAWLRQQPGLAAVSREVTLAGTGGGAEGVWRSLGCPSGPLVVINGDILSDVDVTALLAAHRRSGAVATLATVPAVSGEGAVRVDAAGDVVELPGRAGPVVLGRSGRMVTFAGVSVVESALFGEARRSPWCVVRDGLAPALASGARIATVAHAGFWADLGTATRVVEAMDAVFAWHASGRPLGRLADAAGFVGGEVWLGAGHRDRSELSGLSRCVLGDGCTWSPGTTLERVHATGASALTSPRSRAVVHDGVMLAAD